MRRGVRIGVDVGAARVGTSRSDVDGLMAVPLETVPRKPGDPVARIVLLGEEYSATEYVVGLPLGLSGRETPSTKDAEQFAQQLARASGVRVRLVDERLSTVTAQGQLHASGRTTRTSRDIVDQAAAVVILQHALDAERGTGAPPGWNLDEEEKQT